jgi:hypothetical protein
MDPARALALIIVAASVGGCIGRKVVRPDPSTVQLGACADPSRDGVLSRRPQLSRADKDLDGDRTNETVVADRNLCTREGNCYWNVFSSGRNGCERYVGTIEAAVIDRLAPRGEDGYRDLRGWWRLTDDRRVLLQEYRFRQGGYRLVDALLCRELEDDRLLCASDERAATR